MTLGAPTGVDVDQLKAENEQLRKQCDEFTLRLEGVQAKLTEAEIEIIIPALTLALTLTLTQL